ncbi:hypothetical protein CkaCkLH20_08088 [Colletotrichum karsti]|uniref:Uncharacterized protein n=1 Tax=Colletotrichum karsti TaxID=1095194 RepID=A0A9P6I9K1_9PEZI|nr:uncharacterized protein CkaCkLH20_08088 [Colletotrichum karsti]KAF9874525.1 hypothetical protein CkaCkLH20_08088 [Colletotrichum karsti]
MRAFAVFSLLSLAAALPTAPATGDSLAVVERNVAAEIVARVPAEQAAQDAPVLVARALYDQTAAWPATSATFGGISFQVVVTNLNNGRYKLEWYNTDAANSNRQIKLTINSDSGARVFDVVTSPRARGSSEVAKQGSALRVILDQQ